MTAAIVALGIALGFSICLNALLLIINERKERTLLEMFRRREGLELPEEVKLAENAEVVRTAQDLVNASKVRARKRTPAFSIPLPGTEWMQKGKES